MKKFLHKYGTRPNEIRRAKRDWYVRLSVVALAIVFFGMMLVIARFQPRLGDLPPDSADTVRQSEDAASDLQLESLRTEINELMSEFQALMEHPERALENIEVLEKAIALQGQVIRSRGSEIASREDLQKLEDLQGLMDSVMGDYLIAQSKREEELALRAWADGNVEDAIFRINRAILVQESINDQYPRSEHRNATRVHRLSKQSLLWQTQPIAEAADSLREQAYQLVSEHNFSEARKVIRLALQKQETLMQKYRDSRYASLTRMRDFRLALREIDTAENTYRAKTLLQESLSLLESGDHESALAKAETALDVQQRLIEQNGMTDKTNRARLASIREVHDTAASMPSFEMIESAKRDTHRALLTRNMELFQSALANWYRETRLFMRRFPNSSHLDKIDIEEADLLHDLRTEIPVILETVHTNLIELPGSRSLQMLETEVSQALFESVTGSNPSSSKDPSRPVDSVTWEEAQAFTRRLGKVLALPVSLPDESHFKRALGNPSITTIRGQAWSVENANRQVQPCGRLDANEAGFFDLLGNIAEWVSVDLSPEPGQVLAIGGSVRDSRARLAVIPRDWRSPEERNRFIGFRFVVERGKELD